MAEAFYLYNVVPNDKKNSFSPYKAIVWSQNYDPGSLNQTVSDWSNLYSEKFTGPSGETWAWEGKVYDVPYGKNPSDIMVSKTFPKDPISFRFYIPSDASKQADFNTVGGFLHHYLPKQSIQTIQRGNRESKVQDATRKFQLQYICTTGPKPKGPQPSGSNRLGQITVSAIVPTEDNVDGELKFPSKL